MKMSSIKKDRPNNPKEKKTKEKKSVFKFGPESRKAESDKGNKKKVKNRKCF